MSDVPAMVITVDYLERYGSWCAVLECPDGCRCGQRSVVSGFPSREAAQGFADDTAAAWPGSEQAQRLRGKRAGP